MPIETRSSPCSPFPAWTQNLLGLVPFLLSFFFFFGGGGSCFQFQKKDFFFFMDASSERAEERVSYVAFWLGLLLRSWWWPGQRLQWAGNSYMKPPSPYQTPLLQRRLVTLKTSTFWGKSGCFVLLSAFNDSRCSFGLFFYPYVWITYKFENQYSSKITAMRSPWCCCSAIIYALKNSTKSPFLYHTEDILVKKDLLFNIWPGP